MQGYVFVFRPTTGDGTIVTDAGAEVRFTASGSGAEFQGGDIVSFRLERPGVIAGGVQVVQRWSDRLADSCQPLLRQLHNLVRIDAASP